MGAGLLTGRTHRFFVTAIPEGPPLPPTTPGPAGPTI
jgi:hypothetical protein